MSSPVFSPARTAAGPLVFVSGQVPVDAEGTPVEGGIREQATAVFARIAAVLDANGCALADVVKVTYFLRDIGDLAILREVIAAHFGDQKPASSLVEVSALIDDRFRLEIEAIAVIPSGA